MKFKFKSAELPCDNKGDFNTNDITMDIVCRIYLTEAPSKEHERIAKELDGDNYMTDCFFIEAVVGKNKLNGNILTSEWMLYYVLENGDWHEFGFVGEIDEAWNFLKKEISVEF